MTDPAPVSIDFDVPYCVNCRHYIESSTGPSWGRCGYLEIRSVVSGKMENRYCSAMREGRKLWDDDASMALKCDVHGKFFEAKPFVEVPPPPVQIEQKISAGSSYRQREREFVRSRPTRRKPSLMTRIFGV